jgi:aminoacrylate hydrolase
VKGEASGEMTEVGDTALHVVRSGSGAPLLMLVGLGGRAEFWGAQFARFSNARDCISFDHRNADDSVPSNILTTVKMLAEDAVALLDQLGISACDIIGHSLGGAIAQHIAVHHPNRIERLVLSATWAGPTPWFLDLFALRKRVLKTCGPHDYILQGNLLGNPGWWTMERHAEVTAGVAARVLSFAGVDIECERMDAVTGHDLREQVGAIRAKTLVICARDDGITPLPLSEELANRIPGARLSVLPTGNHFAPVSAADDWFAAVDEFLS